MSKRVVVWSLFVLFTLTQVAYLHRVPGLMGDEASEGENVYELWSGQKAWLEGERSYIGPAIDYVRMPFFLVIKHPVLALRSVTLLAAIISFWLAIVVFRRLFGEQAGLLAATAVLFSPVFMLEQRMAWAISLSPFFALLTLYFMQHPRWWAPAFAGLASGLGLSNHILFLPVVAGLMGGGLFYWLSGPVKSRRWRDHGATALLCAVGFAAAFATQAWQLWTSPAGDQGEPGAVAELFWDRLQGLPQLMPLVVSGSSYVARYTGVEFSLSWQYGITALVLGLVIVAVLWGTRAARLWFLATVIHLSVLLVVIDRFSLRYFVPTMLAVWVLVGVGVGILWEKFGPVKLRHGAALALAGVLSLWVALVVLIPFLQTGGSTNDFSLANRTDSASALVDVRPLVTCLRARLPDGQGQGTVTSESVHIFNRLWFLRHYESELQVVREGEDSQWLVNYRLSDQPAGDLCPQLTYFRVEKR